MVAVASPLLNTGVSTFMTVVSSQPFTVAVTGASGSVSYLWQRTGGDDITIDSPTAQDTYVRVSGLGVDEEAEATFVCVVTDDNGPVSSNTVTARLLRQEV